MEDKTNITKEDEMWMRALNYLYTAWLEQHGYTADIKITKK